MKTVEVKYIEWYGRDDWRFLKSPVATHCYLADKPYQDISHLTGQEQHDHAEKMERSIELQGLKPSLKVVRMREPESGIEDFQPGKSRGRNVKRRLNEA